MWNVYVFIYVEGDDVLEGDLFGFVFFNKEFVNVNGVGVCR